jgi:hypothetical protein
MSEYAGQQSLVQMRQSTRFEFENQQVDDGPLLNQFALDIPWTFTYHTHARAEEIISRGCCVSCCGAWVERDIQEKFL